MANNWANRTKQDLSSTPTSQLKRVGGGADFPEIKTYYRLTAPKAGAPESSKQLPAGESIMGIYDGSFTTKRFGTQFHKVQTANGLVAIQGSGQLNGLMKKVPQGAEVQIIYNGRETVAKGPLAGKSVHSFTVNASEVVAA